MKRKKIITTLIVDISSHKMSESNFIRLKQIMNRDTRVIKRVISIIHNDFPNIQLLKKKTRKKQVVFELVDEIDWKKLTEFTFTTRDRKIVKYDIRKEFPRISFNELLECRDGAMGLYHSYLELRKSEKNARIPNIKVSNNLVPRSISARRFKLDVNHKVNQISIMDSMDTNPEMNLQGKNKTRHNYLDIPLKLFNYHKDILQSDDSDVVALRLVRKSQSNKSFLYQIHFSLKHKIDLLPRYSRNTTGQNKKHKPIAVAGIDLGISKDAVLAVITPRGISLHQFFSLDTEIKISLHNTQTRIKDLQSEAGVRKNQGLNTDGIYLLLRKLRNRKKQLKLDADHKLTKKIVDYLEILSKKYDLYIALGDLRLIRRTQFKGNGNKGLRKLYHTWTYARISDMLEYKLAKIALKNRFERVNEYGTSSRCWKCNEKGRRRNQAIFICYNSNCGWKGNADFNGAVNIAKQLIMYFKLTPQNNRGVKGLGKYLPVKTNGKARNTSKGLIKSSPVVLNSNNRNLGQNAGKSQKNLLKFFEYDQSVSKVTETLSSMKTINDIDRGEVDRNTIRKDEIYIKSVDYLSKDNNGDGDIRYNVVERENHLIQN